MFRHFRLLPKDPKLRTDQRVCDVMNAFRGVSDDLLQKLAKWGDDLLVAPDVSPAKEYYKRIHVDPGGAYEYWAFSIDDVRLKVFVVFGFLYNKKAEERLGPGSTALTSPNPYVHSTWRPSGRNVVFDPTGWFLDFQGSEYTFLLRSAQAVMTKGGRRPREREAVVGSPSGRQPHGEK